LGPLSEFIFVGTYPPGEVSLQFPELDIQTRMAISGGILCGRLSYIVPLILNSSGGFLSLSGKPSMCALPSLLVPISRSDFSFVHEAVKNSDMDLGVINRFVIAVKNHKVCRTGPQIAFDEGDVNRRRVPSAARGCFRPKGQSPPGGAFQVAASQCGNSSQRCGSEGICNTLFALLFFVQGRHISPAAKQPAQRLEKPRAPTRTLT